MLNNLQAAPRRRPKHFLARADRAAEIAAAHADAVDADSPLPRRKPSTR